MSFLKEPIVLIDDESEVLEMLKESLEEEYSVYSFKCAHDALNWAADPRHKASLFISDLNMPNMGGLDFCHALRLTENYTPVILMSGVIDKSLSIKAINYGIYGIIEKPFMMEDFNNLTHRAVHDYHIFIKNQKFKDAAVNFVNISNDILRKYKDRIQESERLLSSLGLLKHNPADDMPSLETSKFEKDMELLLKSLDDLKNADEPYTVIKKTG